MWFPGYIDHNGILTTAMIYRGENPHGQDEISDALLKLLRRKSPNDLQTIEIVSGERWDDIEELIELHSQKTWTNIIWKAIKDDIEIEQLSWTELDVENSESLWNLDITLSDMKPFSTLEDGIDYLQSKLNNYHPESPFTRGDTIICIFNMMMRILLKLVPKTKAEDWAIYHIISQATFAHNKSSDSREKLLLELSQELSNFYDVLWDTIQEFFQLYVRENNFDIEHQEDDYEPLAWASFVSFNIYLPIWYIIYLYYADFLTHQEGVKLWIVGQPIDYFRQATKKELRNVLRSEPENEYINHDVWALVWGRFVNIGC